MDYCLHCGNTQIICRGLGDGRVKEEDDFAKIIGVVVFVFIFQGASSGYRR